MGQKVHPYGFRLGINKPWKSRWFVERGYDKLLVEDVKLKAELREKLKAAGVSSVEVERPGAHRPDVDRLVVSQLEYDRRFADDLLAMYTRYCALQGWRTEIMSRTDSDLGGIKDAVMEVVGQGVYAKLKFESGVHRVQRVPVTETQGRIHTSACKVAVMPEADDLVRRLRSKLSAGQVAEAERRAQAFAPEPSG